jgi:hypothetical protein
MDPTCRSVVDGIDYCEGTESREVRLVPAMRSLLAVQELGEAVKRALERGLGRRGHRVRIRRLHVAPTSAIRTARGVGAPPENLHRRPMPRRRTRTRTTRRDRWPPSPTALDRLLEEALVDAYGDGEQLVGVFTMLQDALRVPFEVSILGVEATVESVDLTDGGEIVAVCRRGRTRQRIPILDLPLPGPRPEGAEWIEVYRRFATGR